MKSALFLLSVLFSNFVMAADGGEFLFQPQQGQVSVEPSVGVARSDTKLDDEKYHALSGGVTAQAFFGLTDDIALGGAWGYIWTDTKGGDFNNNVSGLSDIQLNLRGRSVQQAGIWRYGVTLNYSPKAMEYDADGNRDNQFSGRNELTPYVGYEFLISPTGRLGFNFSRDFLLGDEESEGPGWKSKSKGGEKTKLAAYYECLQENNVYGALVGYQWSDDIKVGGSKFEGLDTAQIALYSRYELKQNMYLTPKFNFSRAVNDQFGSSKINRLRAFSLDVGLRFLF